MPDVWFAIPGDLATLTGGYAYARRLIKALPSAGWTPHHLALPARFPAPDKEDLVNTRNIFSTVPRSAAVLVDGLAFGALAPDMLMKMRTDFDFRFTALVHHPLADETGLGESDIIKFKDSERAALAVAQSVVVTSRHTLETLADGYGVARKRLFLATPGTDPAMRARGSGAVPRLLTVATLTHRKAHDVLIDALSRITDLPWTSELVGSLDRDLAITANIRALIKTHGLEERVTLRGELENSALEEAYAEADIFVLPSRHEGYGMVFAEAIARGLPIVACVAGAVTETVPPATGVLVPPDDPRALAEALRRLLSGHDARKRLGDAAWQHGKTLPSWETTAARVGEALQASLA